MRLVVTPVTVGKVPAAERARLRVRGEVVVDADGANVYVRPLKVQDFRIYYNDEILSPHEGNTLVLGARRSGTRNTWRIVSEITTLGARTSGKCPCVSFLNLLTFTRDNYVRN